MRAMTLNNPVAIRSVSSSIACSFDEGEFKTAYEKWRSFVACATCEEDLSKGVSGGGGGGSKENKDGEGQMNDRY